MFNPKYKLTNNVVKMLTAIAEAKAVVERTKILPKQELRLRRQALIRMTHSSTAIEGNRLNIREVGAILARKKHVVIFRNFGLKLPKASNLA